MPYRILLSLVVAVFAGAVLPSPAAGAVCADHPNQKSAQEAGDTRDADGDGIYCEALPCPCLKPGQDDPKSQPETPTPSPKPKVTAQPKPRARPKPPMVFRRVEVRRAIDGDTLAVLLPGRSAETVVRLLGIDAPEVSTTRNGAPECGGEQAAHAAQALADLWDTVTVRLDSTQSRYDRYGRLLAYVIPNAEPETTYQQQLLRQGLAETFSYGSFKRRWGFLAARDSARDADVGVFSLCGGDFHQPLLPRAADIAGPAGDKTLVVTSEGFQRAGSWTPTLDGRTLAALSRRFGAPATYSDCIAEWPELGISAGTTYTPGKCKRSASTGQVKFLTATGAGWRTNRGLGVNDDIDRLDALYPNPPESPFWDDDTDQGYAPLQGYFLGGSDGPLKADLVAIVDADSELVTELGATLIFGAG